MRLITLSFVFALWLCTLSFVKGQGCLRKDVSVIPETKNVDISNLQDTESGKTVRLPCAIGYVGFVRLKCDNKVWRKDGGRKCEPKSCGHPGDTPNGDFRLSILDDFVFGAQVLYECRKGYQMVTRTRHRTCVEQGWDSALPICEALKCPVIQANDDVVVIGNSEDATYGNVIQFECQSNRMVLNGSSEIDCNHKGEWSRTVPTCEVIKCYAPDIANGEVIRPPRDDYNEDDTLKYSCNRNYVMSQRASKCTKMGNIADWSPTPECEEVKCKLSLPPTRGTSYTPAGRNLFLPGESLKVTCTPGFWNFFSRQTEDTITCKEDGQWSSSTDCELITCGDPRNSLVSFPQRWQRGQLRETQRYNCRTGFKTANTRGVATCTSDGSWTPDPLCEEITCDKPDILNAVIKDPKTRYKFNDQLTYECKMNYELLDSTTRSTATCTTNGWTKTLGCKEIEGACINPTVMNGFIVLNHSVKDDPRNSKIYYSCNVGFKPSTGGWWGEATCTEGTWSGISKCIDQSQCGPYPVIPNTKVPHKEVYYNEKTVTIDCKDGYTSEKMTITCNNGEWQTPLPACEPQGIICDPPPKVENAIVKIPYQNTYIDGFEVNYECRKSFEIEGLKKITCKNGNWTTPPPTCKQYCGKPEGAGRTMPLIPDRERYENGDQVEYGCLATCKNGEWDKTIKGKDYCSKPEGADTRMLLIPDRERYENGDKIDYGCLSGPNTGSRGKATCKNGAWSKTIECQVTCPPAPPINNGYHTVKERDGEGAITEVSYQCNLDYTLSFTGSIRCLNGEWQTPPKCLQPCEVHTFDAEYHLQDLPQIMYMEHGEKKTLRCKHGYYHKHAPESNTAEIEVECNDGEINYPFPKCIDWSEDTVDCGKDHGQRLTQPGKQSSLSMAKGVDTCLFRNMKRGTVSERMMGTERHSLPPWSGNGLYPCTPAKQQETGQHINQSSSVLWGFYLFKL
ncbi:coagulation factor XIII B chain-like isoform X1 [Salvelinus fontinalis]|uniref:coagulation factor XIII B chain-like isoform X1 n=1 Tax=Salvelinus fontinalis TaxID=8038 RepID=UPI0024866BCA|nr:coagulation factor XIII B chain-like isoform X1 [Salvelinus fontinalis]